MLFWLLWLVIVVGGFYMAVGYSMVSFRNGFDLAATANALIYCSCAVYGVPKFISFLKKK